MADLRSHKAELLALLSANDRDAWGLMGPADGNLTTALRMYHGGRDQTKWGDDTPVYAERVLASLSAIKALRGNAHLPNPLENPALMSDAELDSTLRRGLSESEQLQLPKLRDNIPFAIGSILLLPAATFLLGMVAVWVAEGFRV